MGVNRGRHLKQRKTKSKSEPVVRGGDKGARGEAGPMSVRFLQELVSLMAANDLHVVELREGERRIKLQRGAGAAMQHFVMPSVGQASPQPASVPAVTSGGSAAAGGQAEDAGLIAIKSPMVGTFYSASSPDAKAFVSVGSEVDEETDVCIIEAMKVFNNIKAECRGTIAKIMVSNGQTVEFGTVLFLVKPA